ncbi:VOC family protein [Bacillus luteolus]|uniref:VOC family protein n=1 Tax=Litchfieldia luteola TaxID=682179 RepID=A0ABR9QKC0_9BACI|nr:VOC family protein [Cytobacillus luteolus]MBE4908945.1 VOC family protein [Cytobacillus luteolus]MBP1941804.1 catechol 2,3-dioxygenase-like lactoylglutathione lyase family enzyme [Cytobacillus luteolus]
MKKGIIHHIELYVSNLENSKRFWTWLLSELGYEPFQKWDKGFSWKLGDTYLVFVQVEERYNDVTYHRCRVGLNHLAFHLDSKEEVNEITEKLMSKNIPLLYKDRHPFAGGPDYYAVFFEDPDRIKVELVAP